MITFPNAKINLGLHITQKRKDGYHEIESCMVPIPLCDALEMVLDKKPSWAVSGLSIPGDSKDNLILKAEKLLKKDYQGLPSLQIHLHKHIPMGAGLGGGSADGAFALKLMNNLFDLHLDDFFLEEYAAELGSDCPFFIINQPVQATGRGEIMQPITCTLSSKTMVLVCPGIHVSTADAFRKIRLSPNAPSCASIVERPIHEWKANLFNDFEETVFSAFPEIANIKKKLYDAGAVYASMTGTGSTVYGIFETSPGIKNLFPAHYQLESILL